MSLAIDLNRGVICGREKLSGTYIYMYLDTPGVYYTEQGLPVPEAMAKLAGLDVLKHTKDRIRRERMAEFNAVVSKELDMVADPDEEVVLEVRGNWKVVAVGAGYAHIKDLDGNQMTAAPLAEKLAIELLDKLCPKSDNPASGLKALKPLKE